MRHPTALVPALVAVIGVMAFSQADAQTADRTFDRLERYLDMGSRVFVVTREEGEVSGTLERLSPDAVTIRVGGASRELTASEIGWIDRVPDPVRDGAVVGGVFGYLVGGLISLGCEGDPPCGFDTGRGQKFAFTSAAVHSSLFVLIDYLKRDRWLVFGARPPRALGGGGLRRRPAATSLGDVWALVRPGDTILVRDRRGQDLRGRFERASSAGLVLSIEGHPTTMTAEEVVTVKRRTTLVRRGIVFGAGAGAVVGALAPNEYFGPGVSIGLTSVFGAILGAGFGRMLPGYPTVYERRAPSVRVVPTAVPRGAGLAVVAAF